MKVAIITASTAVYKGEQEDASSTPQVNTPRIPPPSNTNPVDSSIFKSFIFISRILIPADYQQR